MSLHYIPIIDLVGCESHLRVQDSYTKEEWSAMAAKYDSRIVDQIDKKFNYQPPSQAFPDGMKILKPRYTK